MRVPKLLSKAWASNGLKNDIPTERSDSLPRESATYNDGFPQITMTPISMGGKAPSGKDMNGALNELSDHIVYQNKGGIYPFNAEFAEKIGGYPKGAILINDRLNLAFQSLVDNNKTNFNTQNYSGKWVVVFGNDFFVPKTQTATISRAGIVQLTDNYNGDSQTLGLTQKAGKAIKALIDSLTRSLSNYIPNSKKSNAVNSPSSETVATSAAAKTAYDKGVEGLNKANAAQTAANNANTNANGRAAKRALTDDDLNNVTASGIYGQNANANATPQRHYPIAQAGMLIVTEYSGYGTQQLYAPFNAGYLYARGRNENDGWDDWKRIDGLNGVAKSGDTMTGNLVINNANSLLKGQRNGADKYAVGLRNSTSNDVVVVNYTDNTVLELRSDSVYTNKTLVSTGMSIEGSDYSGLSLKNLSGRYVKIEGVPHSSSSILNFVYREANGNNINVVSVPKKSGTMALLEDVRNVNRRDYNRTIKGTNDWDNGKQKDINISGQVITYPDGRIQQIFHLKHFRMTWFAWEDHNIGYTQGDRGQEIFLQLWSAMPNRIVNIQAIASRSTNANTSAAFYNEAGEFIFGWNLRKQGNNKDRIWINAARNRGGADEFVDLYIVVEGY